MRYDLTTKMLAFNLIKLSLQDLSGSDKRKSQEALLWFKGTLTDSLISFEDCCASLGIDHIAALDRILADKFDLSLMRADSISDDRRKRIRRARYAAKMATV